MIVDRSCEPLFSALASGTRLHIVELLCARPMNVREMSSELQISPSIVARHIQMMEKAGIVKSESVPGERGLQKLCSIALDGLALTFEKRASAADMQVFDIAPGQYSDWAVEPTCGLLMQSGMLGYQDDPRYFADPRRNQVMCLWLGHGHLEYIVPNYFSGAQKVTEIRASMEICSEAPGYAMNWPSDIYFSLNGKQLGHFTCPGDFGDKPGLFTPEWYQSENTTQYGQLKQLTVNATGSFIDGVQISDLTISDLDLENGQNIRFRIESPKDASNPRGFTLFGKGFGNYDQNILITLFSRRNER